MWVRNTKQVKNCSVVPNLPYIIVCISACVTCWYNLTTWYFHWQDKNDGWAVLQSLHSSQRWSYTKLYWIFVFVARGVKCPCVFSETKESGWINIAAVLLMWWSTPKPHPLHGATTVPFLFSQAACVLNIFNADHQDGGLLHARDKTMCLTEAVSMWMLGTRAHVLMGICVILFPIFTCTVLLSHQPFLQITKSKTLKTTIFVCMCALKTVTNSYVNIFQSDQGTCRTRSFPLFLMRSMNICTCALAGTGQ